MPHRHLRSGRLPELRLMTTAPLVEPSVPVSSTAPKPKYDIVDALRGIAVLGVIAVHTSIVLPSLEPAQLYSLFHSGQYGVQLFYVVSAFTMMTSWHNRKTEDRRIAKFFIRRYFRIAPMFYVGIILYTGFYFLTDKQRFVTATAGSLARDYLSTLTFTHGFFPASINRVVAGGWSIAVEFTFYALFPLLAGLARNLIQSIVFLVLAFATCLLAYWYAATYWGPVKEFTFFEYWFPNHFFVFSLGFILYFLVRDKIGHVVPNTANYVGFLISAVALVVAGTQRASHVLGHIPFSLLFLPFTYFAIMSRPVLLRGKWIQRVGVNSFSIYIWQYAIIGSLGIINRKMDIGLDGLPGFAVIFTLSTLISFILSELSREYIEDPGQDLGKRIIRRMDARARATAAE